MAVIIREYRESDAPDAGRLIAETYTRFNLAFAAPDRQAAFLGPFQHAFSDEPGHREVIARVLQAAVVLVAVKDGDGEKDGEVVGVLRGRPDKLQSLFVRGDCHRQGIGRRLVERFEQECARQGSSEIRLMSTLYAVPFYQAMGYRKTTGVRTMRSFDGDGLPYQPMKKKL